MSIEAEVLDPRAASLAGKGFDTHSQSGEDGFIAAALERIGVKNRHCFEVGAADGEFYSNTLLLREFGWSAVLIEADAEQYAKLRRFESPMVRTVHERIGPDSLNWILRKHGAPADLDFGCIDIDGQDYWCWRYLTDFRPRLMLVEYSPYGSPDYLCPLGGEGQTGANPLIALGREKGYLPLLRTRYNLLFCREDEWPETAAE